MVAVGCDTSHVWRIIELQVHPGGLCSHEGRQRSTLASHGEVAPVRPAASSSAESRSSSITLLSAPEIGSAASRVLEDQNHDLKREDRPSLGTVPLTVSAARRLSMPLELPCSGSGVCKSSLWPARLIQLRVRRCVVALGGSAVADAGSLSATILLTEVRSF